MPNQKRNGQRKPRTVGLKATKPDLGYYLIVTDTKETEQNYLFGLRDSIPEKFSRRLTITVTKTKTSKLIEETLSQVALHSQYVEPWIVFDRDQVQNFDKIIEDAKTAGINVAWSNPCIEIWFNSYLGAMPSYQNSVDCCDGFKKDFKKITNKKYQKSDKNIYKNLCMYGNENHAILLAESKINECLKNGKTVPSKMCPATTMHILIKEIKGKI